MLRDPQIRPGAAYAGKKVNDNEIRRLTLALNDTQERQAQILERFNSFVEMHEALVKRVDLLQQQLDNAALASKPPKKKRAKTYDPMDDKPFPGQQGKVL